MLDATMTKAGKLKLAVLFHRIGPMHHARLCALAERGTVMAIEFTKVDSIYQWDVLEDGNGYFKRTLFQNMESKDVPSRKIRRRVTDALDSILPDVVAVPGWYEVASLAALDWCIRNRRRAVLMSDSTAYDKKRSWFKEAIKQRIIRACSTALVGGRPHVEYLIDLGFSRDHIFTKYDVVDNSYFSQAAWQVRNNRGEWQERLGLYNPYFLASSRFIEKKNILRLIKAYASYVKSSEEEPWDLVILGDGEQWDQVTIKIQDLNLQDKVHLPGFRQYAELPGYYALANVFIHASTTEQWGLVVNEAMATGLPVLVSSRCGCVSDLVAFGVNGYSFDPYNTQELTYYMQHMSSPDTNLKSMGAVSKNIIREYTPDIFADNLWEAANLSMLMPYTEPGVRERSILWALQAV